MPTVMSTASPALPWTYRPLGVRVVLSALAVVVLVVITIGWVTLPSVVRAAFSPWQIITLLLMLGAALTGMYGLGRCRVSATDDGVEVVNVFRRRRLEWPQILQVTQRPGDPWAVLDTDDGTTVVVMAIQGSDGSRARIAVRQLATLVVQQTRTPRND